MSEGASANLSELWVQGVTTVYTLEIADIIGPNIRAPIGDLSSLAENLLLLRYIELRSRLYRLISVLKVRDSSFDPSLHEYTLTDGGTAIEPSSLNAEGIMAGFLHDTNDPAPDSGPTSKDGS